MNRQEWQIRKEEEGTSLLVFLAKQFPHMSKKQVKRWIEQNACDINGKKERFARTQLRSKDRVRLYSLAPEKREEISVVFQDDSLLIVSKPTGVVSDSPSLCTSLSSIYGPLFLVHRLDKGTSGLLLFARDRVAEEHLLTLFRKREVEKEYVAVVEGVPEKERGRIEIPLLPRGKYEGQTIYGPGTRREGAKSARTDWLCLARGKKTALLRCFPKTGRTHQIRVHLASIGHPILGDFQYCRSFASSSCPLRLALHAYRLCFVHPKRDEMVEVVLPPPRDFLLLFPNMALNLPFCGGCVVEPV